jgi:DNA polymerase zeta
MNDSSVICSDCRAAPATTAFAITSHLQQADKKRHESQTVCGSCSDTPPAEQMKCESLECEWLYERVKANKEFDRWKEHYGLVLGLNQSTG